MTRPMRYDFDTTDPTLAGFVRQRQSEAAVCLCTEEKSRIQALGRTQTYVPIKPGTIWGWRSHLSQPDRMNPPHTCAGEHERGPQQRDGGPRARCLAYELATGVSK